MTYRVNTTIPCGNAGDIMIEERRERTRVSFAADPHENGIQTIWFNLRIERCGEARPLTLVLKHVDNMLVDLSRLELFRPVTRRDGGSWERLPAPRLEPLPDGRMELAWDVTPPAEWLEVAIGTPYGMEQLEALVTDCDGYWSKDVIGLSMGGKQMVRLANEYGTVDGDRPGIYLSARCHANETQGSWVLDAVLRRLYARRHEAPLVWVIPFVNTDCVLDGDTGKDMYPWDMNRSFDPKAPTRHETLVIQRDARRWKTRCLPALCIDFHGWVSMSANGIYGIPTVPHESHSPTATWEQLEWMRAIRAAVGDEYCEQQFAWFPCWQTPWDGGWWLSRFLAVETGAPAMVFELPDTYVRDRMLSQEDYIVIGSRFGDAIIDRLNAIV